MKSGLFVILFTAALVLASGCGDGGQPAARPAVTTTPTEAPTAATPAPGALAAGKLAFSTSGFERSSEIYVVNADGSGLTQITDEASFGLTWSPDGKRIAFVSNRDGNSEIYVMNADGSGQINLTNNPTPDNQPVWSPDGTRIAFVSGRDATRLPTGTPAPLTELYTPGDYGWNQVYVMNTDGSNQTRLTENRSGYLGDLFPVWSPDGTRIAFISTRAGDEQIYVMNADGSGQTRLTDDPSGAYSVPMWSPDSTRIAFLSGFRHGNPEIRAMNADGSGATALADGSDPAWSPDGTRIAFVRGREVGIGGGTSDIYIVNADGSGEARLTEGEFLAGGSAPAWSPDGTRIAFVRGSDVYVMNADGSDQTRLADGPADFIAWSPAP